MDAGVLEVNVGVDDKTGDVEEACGVLLVASLGLLWRMISTPVTMPVPNAPICSFACLAPVAYGTAGLPSLAEQLLRALFCDASRAQTFC